MYESIPNELRTMEAGSKRMEPYKRGLLHRAAKAIEELSMRLHGDEAAIAGMKREIERMVRADKSRWIPVTERLPEENGRYIVAYEDATSVLDFFNGKWFFPWHSSPGCTAWEEEGTIQAWMPLPEPPKEEHDG